MKIALLGDTHGRLDERIAALVRTCDLAVHTGDVGGQQVLNALRPLQRLVVVHGNNDTPRHWPESDIARLGELPEQACLDLPGGRLAAIHGHQWPAKDRHRRLRQRFPDCAAVVYGHSHRLCVERDTRPWILNPGAAGRSRTYGGPSCLVLTAQVRGWSVREHRFDLLARR